MRGRDAETSDAAGDGGKRPQAEVQKVGRFGLHLLHAVRRANKQKDTPKRQSLGGALQRKSDFERSGGEFKENDVRKAPA